MKKIILFILICTATICVATAQTSKGFTMIGKIANMPDSARVALTQIGEKNKEALCETFAHGENFKLEGNVALPSLYEFSISVYNAEKDYYAPMVRVPVMIDNTSMSIQSIVPFDSLVNARYEYAQMLLLQMKGGKVMDEWNTYCKAVAPLKKQLKEMGLLAADKYFENHANRDTTLKYNAMKEAIEKQLHDSNILFAKHNPEYYISAVLVCNEIETPFTYTRNELEDMASWIHLSDTAWTNKMKTSLKSAILYARDEPFKSFEVTTKDNKMVSFSNFVKKGKYTLIDFWASWCGPCRAAIPHVKTMYNDYKEHLDIYSVSVDKKNESWIKAMKEENMPWTQLWVNREQFKKVYPLYHVEYIPQFVLLDDKGLIICVNNDIYKIEKTLKAHL